MNVLRWTFSDPTTGQSYTFTQNPSAMTSPFPERQVQTESTLYRGVHAYEGSRAPGRWTFSGSIRNREHYEALRSWVFEHDGRIVVTDHFGRAMICLLVAFRPVPKRTLNVYWRHDYEIEAIVMSGPTAPTVPTAGRLQ